MSLRFHLQSLSKTIYEKLLILNLFKTRSLDPLIIHREILSTRLYILLLIISVIILTIYTSITNQLENKIVKYPSQTIYENLEKKYSDSLKCSCTNVSIIYGNFVEINPSFHQVCSSDFISQKWIDFIFQADSILIWPMDVRTSLSSMWQLIRSFCQSSRNLTFDTINQFQNDLWINSLLLNEKLLKDKIFAIIHLLRQTTSSNFIQSITMTYKTAQINQLLTALLTNYNVKSVTKTLPPRLIHQASIYDNNYRLKNSTLNCTCTHNDSCPLPGNIYLTKPFDKIDFYDMNQIKEDYNLPGLIIDCLPIQMTFSSTFECFYNQTCLNILLFISSSSSSQINISILNPSLSSRFSPTTKIEFIMNELFIEKYLIKINFNEYYSSCLPNICTYIYLHKFNWFYVLTVLIGLIGGITTVFKLITPYFILSFFVLKQKFFSPQIQQTTRQNQSKGFLFFKNKILFLVEKNLLFQSKDVPGDATAAATAGAAGQLPEKQNLRNS